jgi:sodium-dependent dicarboxylate transporter 2/3/5
MIIGFLFFIVPSMQGNNTFILDESVIAKLPWGILMLLGGGFALAKGIAKANLGLWIGAKMSGLSSLPL